MSERQWKPALVHGNTGRPARNRVSEPIRRRVVELRRGKYDRFNDQHFGIGVHFCLGVVLARMELHELFSRLLARLPELEIGGSVDRVASSFVGGIKRMPIRHWQAEDRPP